MGTVEREKQIASWDDDALAWEEGWKYECTPCEAGMMWCGRATLGLPFVSEDINQSSHTKEEDQKRPFNLASFPDLIRLSSYSTYSNAENASLCYAMREQRSYKPSAISQ